MLDLTFAASIKKERKVISRSSFPRGWIEGQVRREGVRLGVLRKTAAPLIKMFFTTDPQEEHIWERGLGERGLY